MKQKTSKKIAWALAAALCAAVAVPVASALSGMAGKGTSPFNGVYGSTFTAFAEEAETSPGTDAPAAEEPAATYTMQTKGMVALGKDYLLLATNIEDVDAGYAQVGYTVSVNGGDAVEYMSDTYYTGITFRTDEAGGTATQTMEEIFQDNVVTGMVVTEIEYSPKNSYVITPCFENTAGEKESGASVTVPVVRYAVTIEGDAAFAGGEKTAQLAEGDLLPETVLTGAAADGKHALAGWIVTEADGERYVSTIPDRSGLPSRQFVMPGCDVTIEPYIVLGWEHAKDYGGGELDLSEHRTITVGDESFAQSLISHITVDSASITGRYVLNGERVGTVYSFSGDANEYFRIMRACTVRPANERTIKYTLKNVGDTDVSFTAYQVNSQTNIDGVPTSGSITIAAGEEKTLEFTFAYINENVMLLITLEEAVQNAQLWINAEISD